ncbi:hypothetical protein GIB67_041403 [Kingdonia uniflora]|uniref:Myb/SANT-like domain-containing protein n=1 Tax=Kingdonia uniflora TaxID=39325 RepID=A0A7J7LRP5_9MAGN|nr:hypothetical protein GIB67_041403 [Kingdonia uniflora]
MSEATMVTVKQEQIMESSQDCVEINRNGRSCGAATMPAFVPNVKKQINWTEDMDQILITTLRDQLLSGGKGRVGWKPQAYYAVRSNMLSQLGVIISTVNVRSRTKTFKQRLRDVRTLLDMNGFRWDKTRKKIVAEASVWRSMLAPESMKHLRKYRKRAIPDWDAYVDLLGEDVEIEKTSATLNDELPGEFGDTHLMGEDEANGETAKTSATLNNELPGEFEYTPLIGEGGANEDRGFGDTPHEVDSEIDLAVNADNMTHSIEHERTTDTQGLSVNSNRRKTLSEEPVPVPKRQRVEEPVSQVVLAEFSGLKESFKQMTAEMARQNDKNEVLVKTLHVELGKIRGLSKVDRFRAIDMFSSQKFLLRLFLSMSDEDKKEWLAWKLGGPAGK